MTWRTSLLTVGLVLVFFSIVGGQTTSSPICTVTADVVFAIDSSGSITWKNFNKTLDFVKSIVEQIIVVGPKGIQIGILTFSMQGIVQYHLNAHSTKPAMLAATSSIGYARGGTNIASGIKTLVEMFGANNGARKNAFRYGVVITDGVSAKGNSTVEADLARAANITMLAVAVGKRPRMSELEGIANKPSAGFVYSVTGYDSLVDLTDVVQDITNCDNKTDVIGGTGHGEPCTANRRCVDNTECVNSTCICRSGYELRRHLTTGESKCEKVGNTGVGEICSKSTKCISNAQCVYDGSNSAITRCLCKYGHVHAIHNGIYICAAIITTPIDPNCFACESNGGVCYDATGDQKKDGCVCPSFKSQPDCQKSHANVLCNKTTFTMTVCYEEQAQYLPHGAVVLVDGKGLTPSCRATKVTTQGSRCPIGQHQLILPLTESKLGICDTKKLLSGITTMRYQNKIVVQQQWMDMRPADVSFVAYCSRDTHANGRFGPIGVAIATDEQGEHHKPTLTFIVENHLGNPIADDVPIRLGDQIRFRINLLRDGTYAALRVLRCLASSKATILDPTAVTLPLVLNSCPSPGQIHITDQNNWKRVSGRTYDLHTGLVRMFRMSAGHSVHVHCTVQLCLAGSEADCGEVVCTHPAVHTSYGRRKRSTSTVFRLSKTLSWYNTNLKQSTSPKDTEVFSILGFVGVALIVFVAIVTSVVWKRRCHSKQSPEPSQQYSPQR